MENVNTTGKTIICNAAVAHSQRQQIQIERIKVEPPAAGEVRVRMHYSALCNIDKYTVEGFVPVRNFPVVLGHAGAGIIESVGEGVTALAPGDAVVLSYIPQCRNCDACKNPKSNVCSETWPTQNICLMPDQTSRFKYKKRTLYHFMGVSTLSQFTVVAENSVVKINASAPLDKMCLLGSEATFGYGAVVNTCKVEKGSSVAVWGMSVIGLSAIMGAKIAGASRIVAIDINDSKFETAKHFGATDFINPLKVSNDKSFQSWLVDEFDGGFDYTFECIGNVHTMRQALEAAHEAWGTSCVVGTSACIGREATTRLTNLITGRTWKGCFYGGWKAENAIPKLVDEYLADKIDLDSFITSSLPLSRINEAIGELHRDDSICVVINLK